MKKSRLRRIIALVATATMLSVTVFSNIAMAAQTTTTQTAASQLNQAIVNNALAMINKAVSSNKQEDMDAAKAYLKTLTPKEMVAVYAKRMESYYLSNYYKDGFQYFNVSEYIKRHNDVREASAKTNQPLLAAMNHYLYHGILEGRPSCTSFDPMVAILVDSRCAIDAIVKSSPTIDDVKSSFKTLTGKDSTSGYTVVYSSTGEILTAQTKSASSGTGGSGGSGEGGGGGYTPTPTPTPPTPTPPTPTPPTPTPTPQRTPTYINKQTDDVVSKLTTYKFYDNKDLAVDQSIVVGNGIKGTFYGTNYQMVKDTGKKYTMMIYMTASDQEMKDSYVRVSAQIASMMKAGELDNVNVLLCVGGSGKNDENISYYNSYMQKEIAESGLGIYYLDPSGLSDLAEEFLEKKNSEELLEDTTTGKDKDKVLGYDNLINEKTLVKLFTTSNSKIDMGDPGVLTGFINLCSQLYPAADYGLSLSNHGGGLVGGVCISACRDDGIDFQGTSLLTQELEAALSSTDIYKNTDGTGTSDGKLGLLFYDACLMGASEQAYVLKDYYRYMIASEETTMSWTDYYKFLAALNEAAAGTVDDKALAVKLMSDFKDTTWHKGRPYYEGTIAVYSSDGIDDTIKSISDTSEKIAALLDKDKVGVSGTLSNKVFNALRKSMMSCSDYYSANTTNIRTYVDDREYVDVGEFLTYLKSNLSSIEGTTLSDSDNQKLQNAINSLNDTLGKGFIINSNLYISKANAVDSKDNQSIISFADMKNNYSEFWKEWCGANAGYYGASIYFPFGADISALEGTHYIDYEGSGLQGYINLIKKYIEVYPSRNWSDEEETVRLMKTLDIEEIVTASTDAEIKKVGGAEFMVFNVNTAYGTTATQSEIAKVTTTGSPMQDFMLASEKMEIAVTDNTGNLYALKTLDGEAFHLDTNQITVDIADIKETQAYCLISGDKTVKVYIPLSQLEFNLSDKSLAQSAAKDLINGQQFTTFKGKVGKQNGDVVKPVEGDVYHIFLNDDKQYLCSVRETGDDKKFALVDKKETDYDHFKCYSYMMDENNTLVVDPSNDYYWDLSSQYTVVNLFENDDLYGGKVDINSASLSISNDGVNFTEEKSIKGATPVKSDTSGDSNAMTANNEEITIEVAGTKETEEVAEIKEAEKAIEESKEVIQETETVDTAEVTEPVETTQTEIIPVSVMPETTVIQTVETTQEAA